MYLVEMPEDDTDVNDLRMTVQGYTVTGLKAQVYLYVLKNGPMYSRDIITGLNRSKREVMASLHWLSGRCIKTQAVPNSRAKLWVAI